jgi:hypothetical protein
LRRRINDGEKALLRAARDDLGRPAAEWLAFCQRRVPDLITAAQAVYDEADDEERARVVQRLAEHLNRIMSEADERISDTRGIRCDLLTNRFNQADTRGREGSEQTGGLPSP